MNLTLIIKCLAEVPFVNIRNFCTLQQNKNGLISFLCNPVFLSRTSGRVKDNVHIYGVLL